MEHITFIRNAVVFNQIIKAINAVFNPTGIMSLNPTKVQGDDCWHNRYHVLCSVDLSECNKDELVREINSHYRDNNYIWRHVSAEIDENGKLNIYFYSNIDIISQFTSVDQIIRQLDNVVCRIESSIDSDRYHIGTVLVDNDLCDIYKIAVSNLPARYYDEFTKTVNVRYTACDPFHFIKTSVDIRHGGLDVYLFKRIEDTSMKQPSNIELIPSMKVIIPELDSTDKEVCLYHHLVSTLFTKVVTTKEPCIFSLEVNTDIANHHRVFKAVSAYFLEYCGVSLTINSYFEVDGVLRLSVEINLSNEKKDASTIHNTGIGGCYFPNDYIMMSGKPADQNKVDVIEQEECMAHASLQPGILDQVIREVIFIDFVTLAIDKQLKEESPTEGVVCCKSVKWDDVSYGPGIAAYRKLVDYYKKQGWKNVDVKFEKDSTISGREFLIVSVILTPTDIDGSGSNSSKVDVICEKLDKNISAIEQLKWLYAQTSDQVIHDRINNKIGMFVNASVSLLNSFHDKWKEFDPNNKIPSIIEKLQWLINNTSNVGEMDEIIENTINRLITMAVTNIK